MKNVVLLRVDDRLIHGQVMTSWLNYSSANKIMVIDDNVAQDPFMKTVLKSAVPSNVGLGVFSVDKAADRLIKGFKADDRVIILVKYPKTILELMEKGVGIDHANIGGMGADAARKKFYKNISASDEEIEIFKRMIARGCRIEIQIIAEGAKIDVEKLLQ